MKRILLLTCFAIYSFTNFAQLPDMNGYWNATYFSGSSGETGDFNCGVYQDGSSVYALSMNLEENIVFEGTVDSDTLSGDILTYSSSTPIHVRIYNSNDSVVFNYHNQDYSIYGDGFMEKESECGTLIVNFSYTGDLVDVSEHFPIGIDIYDTENILETYSYISVNQFEASGTLHIPGILTDPIYCAISTGYNDSLRMFYDLEMPYTTYGSDPENFQVDPISISAGSVETINLTFDDSYLFHMDSYFPGGKMDYLGSYNLPMTPKYIAYYNNKYYIINNTNNEVHVYSETFDFEYILEDNMNNPIFAHAIQFANDGSFYACNNVNLNQYGNTGELLNSVIIGSTEDADITIQNNYVYYSNRETITKFGSDLTTVHAAISKPDIQNDYPPYASQDFNIRDIAFDNYNRLAIAIDANPDDDGKDMIIFYDDILQNVVDTITGYWVMNNPVCVDFDENDYCYVTSYWHDNLAVHSPDKELFSATFWKDEPGTTNGAMNGPKEHVVVGDQVIIIENGNNRVSVFKLSTQISINEIKDSKQNRTNVYPVPFKNSTNISLQLTSNQYVSINIYDIQGRLIDQLCSKKHLEKGHHKLTWQNNKLKGTYFVVIEAETFTETHQVIKM